MGLATFRSSLHRWATLAVFAGWIVSGCLLPELSVESGTGSGGTTTSGGMGGDASGGESSGNSGGEDSTGGVDGGGGTDEGDGGSTSGGAPGTGGDGTGAAGGGGESGGNGSGGAGPIVLDGPCDVYAGAGHECVAAYSTVRRLFSGYEGPLYQVRAGSSEYNIGGHRVTNPTEATNTVPYTTTPEAGTLHDVPQTDDGFADAAAQDEVCAGTICTVATLYDQSGRGNDLTVAKAGSEFGGDYAALDDFETIADAGPISVGGRPAYSLYMEMRQGYRLPDVGDGIPVGDEPVSVYMLADGTRTGSACCWEFGIVGPDPTTFGPNTALFFGTAYWGRGEGSGPWFGADFEAGVWMGGSYPGEPGWGALNDAHPANGDNRSLDVPLALGFLKVTSGPEQYALRVAHVGTAVETAYSGEFPSVSTMGHRGSVVLGVAADNSNNSFSTFFEGAIVAGYPDDAIEQAVLENIQAVGYGE